MTEHKDSSSSLSFKMLPFEEEMLEEILKDYLLNNPEYALFIQNNITIRDIYHFLTIWVFLSSPFHNNFTFPYFEDCTRNKKFWLSFIRYIDNYNFFPLSDLNKEDLLQIVFSKKSL